MYWILDTCCTHSWSLILEHDIMAYCIASYRAICHPHTLWDSCSFPRWLLLLNQQRFIASCCLVSRRKNARILLPLMYACRWKREPFRAVCCPTTWEDHSIMLLYCLLGNCCWWCRCNTCTPSMHVYRCSTGTCSMLLSAHALHHHRQELAISLLVKSIAHFDTSLVLSSLPSLPLPL